MVNIHVNYIAQHTVVSTKVDFCGLKKSFVCNKNKSGPITEPWGTPDDTFTTDKFEGLSETYLEQLCKTLTIQSTKEELLSIVQKLMEKS